MIEIHTIGLITGSEFHHEALPDDTANSLIEELNRNYKHLYSYGVKVFDSIKE